ncbi:MAG: hypothetical protein PHP06_05135 [Clostridia bacterium]|nr:hypothetical protein [Clostridia bacterium]
MSLSKKIILISIFLMTFFLRNANLCMAEDFGDHKVVLIVVNKVSFKELQDNIHFNSLMAKSSIGLMNVNGAGKATTYKGYASIGSGARANAQRSNCNAIKAVGEIGDIFYRRTGIKANKDNIVNLEINRIKALNETNSFYAVPGKLGNLIRQNAKKVALIGNCYTDELFINPAALIAMDDQGIIDGGLIGNEIITKDICYPYGIKTDYNSVEAFVRKNYEKYDFWVIETGDISRLERYKYFLNAEMYESHKVQILNDIGLFIKRLIAFFDSHNTTLIITTPFYSLDNNIKGDKLTPLIIYKRDIKPGVITSNTTRRKGIVANIDIAPSILKEFDIDNHGMTGDNIYNIELEENIQHINNLNNKTVATAKIRTHILKGYALYQIILIAMFLFMVVFNKRFSIKAFKIAKHLILISMSVPLVLLIEPILQTSSQSFKIIFTVLGSIIVVFFIGILLKRNDDKLFVLSGMIYAIIAIDILTGGFLNKNSIMGYDPIIGARYYGIGNEYGGLFLGSGMLFAGLGIQNKYINKFLACAIPVFTFVLSISSELGANLGLSISVGISALFLIFSIFDINLDLKNNIIIPIFCIISIAIFTIWDIYFTERNSHIANVFIGVRQYGVKLIFDTAVRKINMNFKLMKYTIWSRVLISFILSLGLLFYRPVGLLKKVMDDYDTMTMFWYANIIGAIIGLVVNDSGIVFAATSMIYLVMSILYIIAGYIDNDVNFSRGNSTNGI